MKLLNRLWIRLTLAFVLVAVVAVGIVAFLSARSTGYEFQQYVVRHSMMMQPAVAETLLAYYAEQGSWDGVENTLAELSQRGGTGGMGMGRGRGGAGAGPRLAIADAGGQLVADSTGERAVQQLTAQVLNQGVPLILDGQRVGTLLNLSPMETVLDEQGRAFLARVRGALLWAGLAATGFALGLGLLASRRLTAPLHRLTWAAKAIAGGNLAQRVPAAGGAEIDALGQAFNQMAASLEASERLRRNMMADVAHELRTPLTVIQGNLQALLDGVYPLELDQVASLYDETRLLTRLVDDLRDLALAEAGQLRLEKRDLNLVSLVQKTVAGFAPAAEAAGVILSTDTPAAVVTVCGDDDRLGQIVRNLVTNALRHTPEGGHITVRVDVLSEQARLQVADTGSGIAREDIPYVFDRFYRSERSRSRRGGGSGLGLAITRQLVVAHGGQIEVQSQPAHGTVFTVMLPLSDDSCQHI